MIVNKEIAEYVKGFLASFNRIHAGIVTLPTYHVDDKTRDMVKQVLDDEGITYEYVVNGDWNGFKLYLNQSPNPTDDERLVMMLCMSPEECTDVVLIGPGDSIESSDYGCV